MTEFNDLNARQLGLLRKKYPEMAEKIDARLAELQAQPKPKEPKSTDPRSRMNQTERRYADILDVYKREGSIVEWWYESLTFRVGIERTRYTPDFILLRADGSLEAVEIKGARTWEDARVKFQSAAQQYTWLSWRMMVFEKGAWSTRYAYRRAAAA